MSPPQSVADFLRDRLDEEEHKAQHMDQWWGPTRCECALEKQQGQVLAEVAVKRRIVDYCERAIEAGELPPNATWSDDAAGAEVAADVLRLMTLPYIDHSDYNRAEKTDVPRD